MEKTNVISVDNVISKGCKSPCPFSLVSIILFCLIFSCIVTILQDFYPCFRCLLGWTTESKNSDGEPQVLATQKRCSSGANVNNNNLCQGEVEKVMEKLGIFCNPEQKGLDFDQISTLFNEKEPCSEELKEAFDLFDENSDGFIDARELGQVVCSLGFTQVSEVECQTMITVFDVNGDGRIDFDEFVKLLENSFGDNLGGEVAVPPK